MSETTKMPSRPRIIGVVTAMNRGDEKAWQALEGCDLAEFRADTMLEGEASAADLLPALSAASARRARAGWAGYPRPSSPCGYVATAVPGPTSAPRRGRPFGAPWPRTAGTSGTAACEWVDLEVEEIGALAPGIRDAFARTGVKILVSHHDFRGSRPLPALRKLLAAMLAAGPAAVKFALTCPDRPGLHDLVAFAREVASGPALAASSPWGPPGGPPACSGPCWAARSPTAT